MQLIYLNFGLKDRPNDSEQLCVTKFFSILSSSFTIFGLKPKVIENVQILEKFQLHSVILTNL